MFNKTIHNIYIHIPFCAKKCIYCDFPIQTIGNSISNRIKYREMQDNYIKQLIREIEFTLSNFLDTQNSPKLSTLYFGGGTPSLLSPNNYEKILNTLFKYYSSFEPDYEFTVENDPDSVSEDLIRFYSQKGVNRISLGVQTFNKNSLKLLNRNHSVEQTKKCLEIIARFYNPNQLNMDLIMGIPKESPANLESTVREICKFKPGHISAYILTVEENTRLKTMLKNGLVNFSDDLLANKYLLVQKILQEHNYRQYEVSNYSLLNIIGIEKWQAKHNSMYWKAAVNFFGFGMGASSLINNKRFERPKTLKKYYEFVDLLENGKVDLNIEGENEGKNWEEQIKVLFMGNFQTVYGLKIEDYLNCCDLFGMKNKGVSLWQFIVEWNDRNSVLLIDGERMRVKQDRLLILNSILVEIFRLIEKVYKTN